MPKNAGKLSLIVFAVLILLVYSCGIYRQTQEFDRFVHSRFTVVNAQMRSVAGIDVSKIKNYSTFDFSQMLILGRQMLQGSLPSVMEVTVAGYNPASEVAIVQGADWLLLTRSDTLAKGIIGHEIRISPEKKVTFPVRVNFDLVRLVKSGSIVKVMNMVLGGQSKKEFKKLGLVFKFRFWYHSGKNIRKSPVFITIRPQQINN